MTTILMAAVMITAALILACHTLSVYGRNKTARIAVCVGILLHIILFICLLLLKTDISVAVLIFMCSVLFYSVIYALRYAHEKRKTSMPREEYRQ